MKQTSAPAPALAKAGGGGPSGPSVRAPDVQPEPGLGNRATAGLFKEAEPVDSPPSAGLLVDDTGDPRGGQMRKGELLSALRAAVCASTDEALAGTGRDTGGCPWIDHWFGYYESRDAEHVERALRRYAPEAAGVRTARDYVPLVTARVRRSVATWAETGEITGAPDDVAMAGGGALAGVGAVFLKARPGAARPTDPGALADQLGEGRALPHAARTRMESAFGTSFASVRLHTDANAAQLSDRLDARAFTVGRHVAFAGGEFRPGTVAGDALIAHELAHVVQQGEGRATGAPLQKGGEASDGLEHDADLSAAGAVATLWTGARGRLTDVGRQAMPRLRSGLRLQRCARQHAVKKTVEPGAEQPKAVKLPPREQRQVDVKEASDKLRGVDTWISTQVKAQNVPGKTGVTKLAPEQAQHVAEALELLTKLEAGLDPKPMEALPPKLDEIVTKAKEARKYSASTDETHLLQSRGALYGAISAAREAEGIVEGLSARFDVDDVAKEVTSIETTLVGIKEGTHDMFDGVEAVAKAVSKAKTAIREKKELLAKAPPAVRRIRFVLKSFLALNAPTLTTAPTAEEVRAFKNTLRGNLSEDFSTVFAGGKEIHGFDAFEAYADVLEQQLAVRESMAEAGVQAQSPIPTQGDAEAYFTALAGKPNGEVFAAYEAYASAYFYHRIVDKLGDLNVTGVEELYARRLSIFGTRPLVCTGYAMLGAHLLANAGAMPKHFIVAVRATEADLVGNRIDAGHALAVMNRNGEDFFVSNDSIVLTKAAGIGPDAVAWANKNAPLFEDTGPTVAAANQALTNQLAGVIQGIRQRPKP